MPSFLEQVQSAIQIYQLFSGGESVVVGVSGGADSTALLYALFALRQPLGLTLHAAHINHLLRGEESNRDEQFVTQMCRNLDIPCHILRCDVGAAAKQKGCSQEAAGHEIRYGYFQEIARKTGATRIAVAHNQNDNAETVLMHLLRGCGLSGLCGIPPKNGLVVRPLITINRTDIEAYLSENNISYITDSTNLETAYTRNYIRHAVLPALLERNPAAIVTLSANAQRFSVDNDFINQQTQMLCQACLRTGKDSVVVQAAPLSYAHPALQYRVMQHAVAFITGSTRSISQTQLDAILSLSRTGAEFHTGTLFVRRQRDAWVFTAKKPAVPSYRYLLTPDVPLHIPELGLTVLCQTCKPETPLVKGAILLDKNALAGIPLYIRSRQEGDRFRPAGGNGEKKLKAYFIDEKIPIDQRSRIPLLEAGGKIAAVLGMRTSADFALKQETAAFYQIIMQGEDTNDTPGL